MSQQRYAHEANIERFQLMLKTETDPAKRAMIEQLLTAEAAWRDSHPPPQPDAVHPAVSAQD